LAQAILAQGSPSPFALGEAAQRPVGMSGMPSKVADAAAGARGVAATATACLQADQEYAGRDVEAGGSKQVAMACAEQLASRRVEGTDCKQINSADSAAASTMDQTNSTSSSATPSEEASAEGEPGKAPRCCEGYAAAFRAWMYPLSSGGAGAGAGRPGGSAPRLEALDAPRWVASIQIVCYHMYSNKAGFSRYATWLATWTQLFFLLSGFVLAYVELAKPPKTGAARPSLLRYVRRRLTVIYPAFFLSLLLKVAYEGGKTAFQWAMLPVQALLMQSWLPLCQVEGNSISCSPWLYNGESWFLSVLLLYWLALQPLAEFFRRRGLRFCGATVVVCWLFSFFFQWAGNNNTLASLLGFSGQLGVNVVMVAIRSGPLGYIHVFVAGVAAARVFLLVATRDAETGSQVSATTRRVELCEASAPALLRYGCCLGYFLYAVLLFAATDWIDPYYYFFHNGGMMPIMLLILIGAAIGQDPITTWVFRSKPMLVLGRISYMQYLMQHVLQGWIELNFGWDGNIVAQAIFVPCLMVFSYACQRWVEKPYTEYQRWRTEKKIKGVDDRVIEKMEGGLERMSRTIACRSRLPQSGEQPAK